MGPCKSSRQRRATAGKLIVAGIGATAMILRMTGVMRTRFLVVLRGRVTLDEAAAVD